MRRVKTASGATAVQIVEKRGGVRRILAHLGSAHDELELAVLMAAAGNGCGPGSWPWTWAWTRRLRARSMRW